MRRALFNHDILCSMGEGRISLSCPAYFCFLLTSNLECLLLFYQHNFLRCHSVIFGTKEMKIFLMIFYCFRFQGKRSEGITDIKYSIKDKLEKFENYEFRDFRKLLKKYKMYNAICRHPCLQNENL